MLIRNVERIFFLCKVDQKRKHLKKRNSDEIKCSIIVSFFALYSYEAKPCESIWPALREMDEGL